MNVEWRERSRIFWASSTRQTQWTLYAFLETRRVDNINLFDHWSEASRITEDFCAVNKSSKAQHLILGRGKRSGWLFILPFCKNVISQIWWNLGIGLCQWCPSSLTNWRIHRNGVCRYQPRLIESAELCQRMRGCHVRALCHLGFTLHHVLNNGGYNGHEFLVLFCSSIENCNDCLDSREFRNVNTLRRLPLCLLDRNVGNRRLSINLHIRKGNRDFQLIRLSRCKY